MSNTGQVLRQHAEEDARKKQEEENKVDKTEDIVEEVVEEKTEEKENKDNQPKEEEIPLDLDEGSILKYLSEKRGEEFSSIDDVFKTKEIEVEKVVETEIEFASGEAKAINEFIETTGRTAEEYFRLNRNWDEVGEDEAVREYLRIKKPSFTDDKIKEYIDTKYNLNEDDFDARDIRLAKLDYESLVSDAREHLSKESQKLLKPSEGFKPRQERSFDWSEQVASALESGDDTVTTDKFTYKITDKESAKRRYSSLDSILKDKAFKGSDGEFDPVKLMKTLEAGLNVDSIVSNVVTQQETSIREKVMSELEEPGNTREPESKHVETAQGKLDETDKKELLRRLGGNR